MGGIRQFSNHGQLGISLDFLPPFFSAQSYRLYVIWWTGGEIHQYKVYVLRLKTYCGLQRRWMRRNSAPTCHMTKVRLSNNSPHRVVILRIMPEYQYPPIHFYCPSLFPACDHTIPIYIRNLQYRRQEGFHPIHKKREKSRRDPVVHGSRYFSLSPLPPGTC